MATVRKVIMSHEIDPNGPDVPTLIQKCFGFLASLEIANTFNLGQNTGTAMAFYARDPQPQTTTDSLSECLSKNVWTRVFHKKAQSNFLVLALPGAE